MPERPPLFYPRRSEPARRRTPRRFSRIVSFIGIVVVALGVIYVWKQLPVSVPRPDRPAPVTAPQDDMRREVEKISEKIRSAHLNKDINKWTSCYSPAYPNLGRLEAKMLELWKNYDIKEVSYRISNVQNLGNNQASADIVWNIQVYDHRTHDYTLVRQNYKIVMERGSQGWQIRSSKEEGAS